LLLDPVRAAVERGVDVRLLLRGRNIGDATRREAQAFTDAGARVVPDRLNHAKGAIADAARGALFSANFVPHLGLLDGVEVGMRLDGTRALAEASRYFDHVMAEADLDFRSDLTADELAAGLYADSFSAGPVDAPLLVSASAANWSTLAAGTDFALYEAESEKQVTIYCERRQWRLLRDGSHWVVGGVSSTGQTILDTLEKLTWLSGLARSAVIRSARATGAVALAAANAGKTASLAQRRQLGPPPALFAPGNQPARAGTTSPPRHSR
jgi:hypothetical protein